VAVCGRTLSLNGVMAGHSTSKTGVDALVLPAIHGLLCDDKEAVDVRYKAWHDEGRR
jgi:hypothetical protein